MLTAADTAHEEEGKHGANNYQQHGGLTLLIRAGKEGVKTHG